jgi:hypothetical protein
MSVDEKIFDEREQLQREQVRFVQAEGAVLE